MSSVGASREREPIENLIRALDEAKRSKSKAKTFKNLFDGEVKVHLANPSLKVRATLLTEKWDQTSANKLKKMAKELLGPELVANKRGRAEEVPVQLDLPVEKPGRTKSTKSKSIAIQQANANRVAHVEAEALQPNAQAKAPLLEKWATNWTDAIPKPTIPSKGQLIKRTAIGLAVAASTFALNGYFKANPNIGLAFSAASYTLGAYNVKQLFFDKKG